MARDTLHRKELREDAVQDTMFWLVNWLYRRRVWIISIVSVVVAVGVAALAYGFYQQSLAERQAAAFHRAEKRFTDAGLAETERQTEGEAAFRAFIEAHPDARLTPVAWLYVARIAWQQGDAGKARRAFEAALNHGQATAAQRDVARLGIAKVEEAQGNLETSADLFQALPDEPYQALKEFNLGRLAYEQDRMDEARQHFDKVAKGQPSTALSEWARQALDYLP